MDQKAQELAQEVLNNGKDYYSWSSPITSNGSPTQDEIVVIVKRVKRQFAVNFEEATKRYIPTASGGQCPTCRGTGRVS